MIDELTPTERRILALVGEGRTNQEIAETLGYAPQTIKNYMTIIFQKRHFRDRTQAAIYAIKEGITPE